MTIPGLLDLTANGALQAHLERAMQGRRYRHVKVGLLCGGRMATADLLESQAPGRSADAPIWVQTGCLTKLFTSALVLQCVRRGDLRLDQIAGELLKGSHPEAASHLAGITVAHLLDHAHGLDDSRLKDTSFTDDGRIDAGRIVSMLASTPPLCAPGTACSYSHVGALLLAAILEQVSGRTWYALLREELFAYPGMEHQPGQLRICPSRGIDLTVPMEAMLAFCDEHAHHALCEGVPITSLPGWHSSETGIRCGWKCYGGGWIGHNSEPPAAAAALRVHPQERIAIIVESGDHPPAPVLAAMFGRLLPELVRIRFPTLLDPAACASLNLGRYAGHYENEAVRVAITCSTDAVLDLRAHRRRHHVVEENPFVASPLRPARDGIFYLLPHSAHFAPFVQFTGEAGDGYRFLWNGKSVWRNVANRATA